MSPTLRAAIDLVAQMIELGPTKSTLQLKEWVCSADILSVSLTRDKFEPHDANRFTFEIRYRDGQIWCMQSVVLHEEPLPLALEHLLHEVRRHTAHFGTQDSRNPTDD